MSDGEFSAPSSAMHSRRGSDMPTLHSFAAGSIEAIQSETLKCCLCEEITEILTACLDCVAEQKEKLHPQVFCVNCDKDYHTPAKKSSHKRTPFHCNCIPLSKVLPSEVGALTWPNKLPSICMIVCSNCEDKAVAQWCSDKECRNEILCMTCSRDLHAPKHKRSHVRYPFLYKFIHTDHLAPEVDKLQIKGAASSSSSSSSNNKKKAIESKEDDGRPRNPGDAGDLLFCGEPALEGEFDVTTFACKNTFNAFDIIGSVQIVQVSVGQRHAGAVTPFGTLFMWGSNSDGQLGLNTGVERDVLEPTVVEMPQKEPVRMVACGVEHSACCTMNNRVYTWGTGLMGKLGHETDANRETPTLVDLTRGKDFSADPKEEIVYIAAGPHNTGCVVRGRSDRRQLYVWGANECGQLGTGDKAPRLQPVLIKIENDRFKDNSDRFPEITQLAFGTAHTAALTTTGHVFTWGSNQYGQCGYVLAGQTPSSSSMASPPKARTSRAGSAANAANVAYSGDDSDLQLLPRQVEALRAHNVIATQIACGELTCSVLSDRGEIWSWGSGETHQLGIMDNVDQFLPVKAAVLGEAGSPETRAVSISIGASSCIAVTETGDCYMWGWSVESPIPSLVSHLRSHSVQRGYIGAHDFVVLLTGSSATIYEYRFEDEGDLQADVSPQENRYLKGKRLVALSIGKGHAAAVTQGGKLLAWGSDTSHIVPPPEEGWPEYDPYLPRPINSPYFIKDVRCSQEHSVALTKDGKVLTWGMGGMGRLGHNQSSDKAECSTPTLVEALAQETCVYIAIGPGNTGAVTASGKAYVWGAGNSGQLGNNSVSPVFAPTRLAALQHVEVAQLAFGNRHAACVTREGGVYTWGDNSFGQLGLGPQAENKYLTPQEVKTLQRINISDVDCGDNVTLCLSVDGDVFAWGAGETHQLGSETEDDLTIPTRIKFPFNLDKSATKATRMTTLAVSTLNCACLADNGCVWVWGFALGKRPAPLQYLVQEGINVNKLAIGPSNLIFASAD